MSPVPAVSGGPVTAGGTDCAGWPPGAAGEALPASLDRANERGRRTADPPATARRLRTHRVGGGRGAGRAQLAAGRARTHFLVGSWLVALPSCLFPTFSLISTPGDRDLDHYGLCLPERRGRARGKILRKIREKLLAPRVVGPLTHDRSGHGRVPAWCQRGAPAGALRQEPVGPVPGRRLHRGRRRAGAARKAWQRAGPPREGEAAWPAVRTAVRRRRREAPRAPGGQVRSRYTDNAPPASSQAPSRG